MEMAAVLSSGIPDSDYDAVQAPLGKSTYIDPYLRPKTFGIATKASESLKTIMSIPAAPVTEELRQMYIRSHHHYDVGERVCQLQLCKDWLIFLNLNISVLNPLDGQ